MTGLQAVAFEAWFRDVLQDGTQWFKLSTRTPMGLQTEMVCRFVDMYDGPNLEAVNHWRIRAELEVWERPLMPAGWGHAIDFWCGPTTSIRQSITNGQMRKAAASLKKVRGIN